MDTLRKYLNTNIAYDTSIFSHKTHQPHLSSSRTSRSGSSPTGRLPAVHGYGVINAVKPREIMKVWEAYDNNTSQVDMSTYAETAHSPAPKDHSYSYMQEQQSFDTSAQMIPYDVPVLYKNANKAAYGGLTKQARVRKEQHYSDVRTAFKMYNDMLKKDGLGPTVEKPPQPKTTVLNMRKRFLEGLAPKNPNKHHNMSFDDARVKETKQIHRRFEVCFVFPDFFNTYEDLGKNSIKVDLFPYWKKYSKFFNEPEGVYFFQDLLQELKQKIRLKNFYEAMVAYSNQRGADAKFELPSEILFRNRIEELREDELYPEMARYLVAICGQPIDSDRRFLDSVQDDISRKLRTKFDVEHRIDCFAFVDGRSIKTLLDIPVDTSMIFAGQVETLHEKIRYLTETVDKYKQDNGTSIAINMVKDLWLQRNPSERIDKHYITSALKPISRPDISPLKPRTNITLNDLKNRCSKLELATANTIKAKRVNSLETSFASQSRNNITKGGEDMVPPQALKGQGTSDKRNMHPKIVMLPDPDNPDQNVGIFLDRNEMSARKSKRFSIQPYERVVTEESTGYMKPTLTTKEDPNFNTNSDTSTQRKKSTEPKVRDRYQKKVRDEGKFVFQLPEWERERIQAEYPGLEHRDVKEIYSDFIMMCEVSERRKIVNKQKQLEDQLSKHKSLRMNMKGYQPNWAIERVSLKKQEEEFNRLKLDINSDVSSDVLFSYNHFLKNKPRELGEKVLLAARVKPDSSELMCWENFLHFYTVILKGKGTKEQQKVFVETMLCPGYDALIEKEYITGVYYDILTSNRLLNNKIADYNDAVEQIWSGEFEGNEVIDNGFLVRERMIEALQQDRIDSLSFIRLLNDRIGVVEVDDEDNLEKDRE